MTIRTGLVSAFAFLLFSGSVWAEGAQGLRISGQPGLSQEQRDNARGFDNPLPAPDTSRVKAEAARALGTPGGSKGSPDRNLARTAGDTRAFGTFGIPYTSTRVALGNGPAGALLSSTYPYRAIGRLTMSSGVCTATLIKRSVIVTAAHCIKDFGSGQTSFTNFQFTPGYYRATTVSTAIAPYGTWNGAYVAWPTSWANGTDTGSGSARNNDLAVIILAKNNNQFIGDSTGWIAVGWNSPSFTSSSKTGNLSTAAVTTLGYPCLLDGCRVMQRTDGPTYTTTVKSALQYWQGSNFTSGSSGGPWIVNFKTSDPVYTGGANTGTAPEMYVVGVTSWGDADPNTSKNNYSSRFGQNTQFPNAAYGTYGAGNIGYLLNFACNQPFAGSTYRLLGYCD